LFLPYDVAHADATQLDVWVLEQLLSLLSLGRDDPSLDKTLRQPKTFFFLHLLGLDTTGHSYRPHSPEYYRNIAVVDSVVRRSVEALESFFGDGRTSYVFTADHGMSNIGNHGDGDPDCTRTPLIAWGSGVIGAQPTKGRIDVVRAREEVNWGLELWERKDVEQADVAALMVRFPSIRMNPYVVHVSDIVDARRRSEGSTSREIQSGESP
jgi:GPI ethanolamine phosphate transferase 1